MSDRPRVEPAEVVMAVEMYVDSELRDAEKFTNRAPLDESGVWSLHALAAEIYAMAWDAAERATAERFRRARSREVTPTRPTTAQPARDEKETT